MRRPFVIWGIPQLRKLRKHQQSSISLLPDLLVRFQLLPGHRHPGDPAEFLSAGGRADCAFSCPVSRSPGTQAVQVLVLRTLQYARSTSTGNPMICQKVLSVLQAEPTEVAHPTPVARAAPKALQMP